MNEYHVNTFVMRNDWGGKFDFLKDEGVEFNFLPLIPEIISSQIIMDLYDTNDVESRKTSHEDIDTDPH